MNIFGTNCGLMTKNTFDAITFNGEPSITHSHIPYFHSLLCSCANSIAIQCLWVLVITAHNKQYLLNRIKQVVPQLEPIGWKTDNAVNDTWTDQTQDIIGCIYAQGVTLPGESTNIDHAGITEGSRRGFINAPIVNGRADFGPLSITFLETNQSFTEGVLRPWNILVSHEGLLARPRNNSIKADISVYQLARAGEDVPLTIRKSWTFKDCVPSMISSEDLTYNPSSDYGKRQTSFIYNSYSIQSMDCGNNEESYVEVRRAQPIQEIRRAQPLDVNEISTTPVNDFTSNVQNLA